METTHKPSSSEVYNSIVYHHISFVASHQSYVMLSNITLPSKTT